MDEELTGTDSNNTAEYGQDEFENVDVEAAERKARGRNYERKDDSLEPYAENRWKRRMVRKSP